MVYPILSKLTEIPFNNFKTLSSEHASVLSVFTKKLLLKYFKHGNYNDLFNLLDYYPLKKPVLATTYKIKDTETFLKVQNDIKNFYGFNTKLLPYDIIRNFVGKISRIKFESILNGHELSGIQLSKIEKDMIVFYSNYFAGNFDDIFQKMKLELYSYF
jgi:hypothetical protein